MNCRFINKESEILIMDYLLEKDIHKIDKKTRILTALRYHVITQVINKEFWHINNNKLHSFYVGSYGRGTAIKSSDIDILLELPEDEYNRFDRMKGNGQSRLIQAVKNNLVSRYPRTEIHGDGQVVVVNFSDGMKLELLPAFKQESEFEKIMYKYPDTNMGGKWKSTNPKKEQEAMKRKNDYLESNGLLFDTCKHMRFIRDNFFTSFHLSGIVIDTFVYSVIDKWHWVREGEISENSSLELSDYLLQKFNKLTNDGYNSPILHAPGSGQNVSTKDSIECLEKVLRKMAGK